MGKLPAFLFYPNDWRTDPNLCRVSKSARDTWMDMLCLMFFSEERGVLVSGDLPWSDEEIAGAIRGDHTANLRDIEVLLEKGVAVRDTRGAIFSKRMVRDEQDRQAATNRKRLSRSGHADVTPLSVTETERAFEVDVGSKESKAKPSSKEEVAEYCTHRRNHIDPQKFFDYYTANGWKVGRNAMKDWRAAVRNWESRDELGGGNGIIRESPAEARRRKNSQVIEQYRSESAGGHG